VPNLNNLLKKIAIALFALLILTQTAFAEPEIPSAPNGYVLDEAGILYAETVASLESTLSTLDKETSTQIVVVTVSSLQGYEPEQFALALGRAWGVGQEEFNNGLIFLIAPTERTVRIEVGYGLEGIIPDATAWKIIDNIATPAFSQGDYNAGTLESISTLNSLVRGETFDTSKLETGTNNLSAGTIIQLVLFFFFFGLQWLSRSKSWWLGGIIGGILGAVILSSYLGIAIFALLGLIIDYLVSKYAGSKFLGPGGFFGGGRGSGSGGFGGFGGGSFGGGGASGHW